MTANLNGVSAGNGIYGQNSTSTNFTVGRSLITKINLDTERRRRSTQRQAACARIPISGGKPGWQTRSGTKLIMDKRSHPDDQRDDRRGRELRLKVRYAMRITWSGEFLHAAPWNSATSAGSTPATAAPG